MAQIEHILTSHAPKPLGHYSQAARAGGFIHVSGQLPIKPEGQSEQSDDLFDNQASLVLRNLLAVLEAAGATPSHVVKVTAYIVGVEHWSSFNAAYAKRSVKRVLPGRSFQCRRFIMDTSSNLMLLLSIRAIPIEAPQRLQRKERAWICTFRILPTCLQHEP